MFFRGLRAIPLQSAIRRHYSGAPPYNAAHATLRDVEGLFEKHQLHKLKSKESIDELVRAGVISEHIGNELNHDLKTQQEAGSKIFKI